VLNCWSTEPARTEPDSRGAPLEYSVPAQYVLLPEPPPVPAYVEAWRDGRPRVIILGIALSVLTLILFFQNELTKRRRLFRIVRNSFLVFTLGWIG